MGFFAVMKVPNRISNAVRGRVGSFMSELAIYRYNLAATRAAIKSGRVLFTSLGYLDAALLTKTEGGIDDANECTTWVEYRPIDPVIHRSAHVTLKRLPSMFVTAGTIPQ